MNTPYPVRLYYVLRCPFTNIRNPIVSMKPLYDHFTWTRGSPALVRHTFILKDTLISLGQNGCHCADDIFKCILMNNNFVFWFQFHLSLFLRVQLTTIDSIGSGNGLAPNSWQAIIWSNADLVHWHIYATLGGDELKHNYLGLLLLTWFNFNPSMDKWLHVL